MQTMYFLVSCLFHTGMSTALLCDHSCQPFIPIETCDKGKEPIIVYTYAAGTPITTVQCKTTEAPVEPLCPEKIERSTDKGSDGANVSFPVAGHIELHPSFRCSHVSGTKFPIGHTNVTCWLEDSRHSSPNCSFVIVVQDKKAPTMICSDKTYTTHGRSISNLTYDPIVHDNADTSPLVVCNASNGDLVTFPLGLTRVTCHATDYSGNVNSCSFIVSIVGRQPVVFMLDSKSKNMIFASNISSLGSPTVVHTYSGMYSLAFDPVDQILLYSLFAAGIKRYDVTRGFQSDLAAIEDTDISRPMAVDHIGRRLYTVPNGPELDVMDLPNGTNYRRFSTDIDVKFIAMAHDSEQSYLLATNKTAVCMMMLDGSDLRVLLNDDSLDIRGLVWDRQGKRIFFTSSPNSANNTIEVIDMDGENRRVLIERHDIFPEGVAYKDGEVYWINHDIGHEYYGKGIGAISADIENGPDFNFTSFNIYTRTIFIREDVADDTYMNIWN